jgi:signal transduction histidine kinase
MSVLAQPPAPGQALSILLLEDDVLDAELTCASLGFEEGECSTTRVDNRIDFENAVKTHSFDVVLADYSLPSFDGISALKIAQTYCPDTPFIFVSGALGEELAIETLKQGATDYVLKHRLERLRPSVLRALREKEARFQKQRAETRLRELADENARLYDEARRANVAKDEFIAMISHELRTPMTSILGWTRMLKLGDLGEDDFRSALNAVERSATVQAQLIEDLLDVSRITTGKLTLNFETLDLVDVVTAAADGIRVAADEKKIEIVRSAANERFLVRGDRNRLQQVVANLLQNAVKFTAEGGRIEIVLDREDGLANLFVRDNGIGIRPEFLRYLFEPFRQDDESKGTKAGLGLGLSIVRHIIERHGGTVAARSEGEGLGATFELRVPLLTSRERKDMPIEEITKTAMPDLTGTRVLLVEDDDETRRLLTTILTRCHATFTAAASVADAAPLISAERWDVIVSDIAMPEQDGYALISMVKEMLGDHAPPVMALTAFGAPEDRRRIANAGFARHLMKPIDPFIFARTIATVSEQARVS